MSEMVERKLWLLKRPDGEWGYDQSLGFVVRADSEEAARDLVATCCGDEGPFVWLDAAICEPLQAVGPQEIILEAFNAG